MELLDGIDLSRLVRRCGPLALADACELIRQAASGLQYAHECGLVHRDVKPSNLMSLREREPEDPRPRFWRHLLGRNEATVDELTVSGQMMGTADYMAPEQWEASHDVDIQSGHLQPGLYPVHAAGGTPPLPGRGTLRPAKDGGPRPRSSPAPWRAASRRPCPGRRPHSEDDGQDARGSPLDPGRGRPGHRTVRPEPPDLVSLAREALARPAADVAAASLPLSPAREAFSPGSVAGARGRARRPPVLASNQRGSSGQPSVPPASRRLLAKLALILRPGTETPNPRPGR